MESEKYLNKEFYGGSELTSLTPTETLLLGGKYQKELKLAFNPLLLTPYVSLFKKEINSCFLNVKATFTSFFPDY